MMGQSVTKESVKIPGSDDSMRMQGSIESILIVDDVKEICDYLSLMLNNLGFWSIDCVYNGETAYQKLKNKSYDLVFLDIETARPRRS